MVAGATGIDLFLLVVAADDGVMPQTREHAAIVQLLGIPDGVVALTKRDLVDDEAAELARLEIAELLDGGPYAGAEVVEVSSRTGLGLDELRAALDRAAGAAQSRPSDGPVRLPSTARSRSAGSAPSSRGRCGRAASPPATGS